MAPLHRKLLRDLLNIKGQATAIAVVIGAGVMVLMIMVSTLDAVQLSQQRYYSSHRLADVFVDLKRAPLALAERFRTIDGVEHAETRVKAPARLELKGFEDPITAQVISVPDGRQPNLNQVYLRAGTLPAAERNDQVVINETFAQAHGLLPGARLQAIINGRLETLTVSGIGLSPEFVYQVGPGGLMPDYARSTIMWMNERALAHAFNMDGAFNSVLLRLQAGADTGSVINHLDAMLERHGGMGAFAREDLTSHRFVNERIEIQQVLAVVLPLIFLSVAAFLLNVLISRIIHLQRQQIAVLKAFGYHNREVALHYAQLTGLIVCLGVVLGLAAGAWASDALATIYAEYFRFPHWEFGLRPGVILLAFAVALGAAALGTWHAVARAVRLPPAEAMRPPAPEHFHQGWLEASPLGRMLDGPGRMILRNLARHRIKSLLSILGIGLSAGLLLVGSYQFNAVDRMLDTEYRLVQKADLMLTLTDPTPVRALAEIRQLPGVHYVEGYRNVPARLQYGQREYRTAILGMDRQPRLRALLDADRKPLELPPEGLLLTNYLADELHVQPGDTLTMEVMEGQRRTVPVQVAAVVNDPVGVSAYMARDALNRVLREGASINGAWLLTDPDTEVELLRTLRDVPRLASIGLTADAERNIRSYIEDTLLAIMGIMVLLASSIAFAVVYNNARITFSERMREFATLRVLGFSHAEVGWILVGESLVIVLLAIPVGWLVGTGFAWLLNQAMTMDMLRIPFVITARTYAFAAAGVLLAAVLSNLLMLRRLRALEMVSALKTIE